MGEIKFRVWDKKNRCFFRPTAYLDREENLLITINGEIVLDIIKRYDDITIFPNLARFELVDISNRFILLQYTGLKDTNGQEIYEGDIIEHWRNNDEKMKEIFVVENLQDFLKFVGVREIKYGEDWNNGKEYVKVLGNIYENPELLKEVK